MNPTILHLYREPLSHEFLSTYPDMDKYMQYFNQPISNPNKSCYIATMVYGDIDHHKVEILRQYRDTTLKQYFLGNLFIKIYYKVSPTLVKYLDGIRPIENALRKK